MRPRSEATPVLTYREAHPADLEAICRLGTEVNAIHHAAFPSVFAAEGAADRDSAHWLAFIAQPSATTFLAQDSGEVVGFICLSVVRETHSLLQPMTYGRIGSVAVSEARRGSGIGRELMRLADDWAVSRGADEVRLNVWAFNQRAVRLYEELGYEVRSHTMVKSRPQREVGRTYPSTPS